MADQLLIDCREVRGHLALICQDNGLGLNRAGLHKMLSFGHSAKTSFEAGRHRAVGRYGNGFKSGSMRLGEDALVLTRCSHSQSVGLLSQTFLREIDAQEILVPMVSWDLQGQRLFSEDDEALAHILRHSLFDSEEAILAQLNAGITGTTIFIWRLRGQPGGRNTESGKELDVDTDPHDIRIAASDGVDGPGGDARATGATYSRKRTFQQGDVPIDYSLRAYLAILYRVPRMLISIRGTPVRTKRASSLLADAMMDTYTPSRKSMMDGLSAGQFGVDADGDGMCAATIEMGWSTDGRLRKSTESLYLSLIHI